MNSKTKRTIKILSISLFGIIMIAIITPYIIPVSKAQKDYSPIVFENSKYLTVDNMLIHYRVWEPAQNQNNNQWILLLHGMGGSTYSWENNASVFCNAGYNVVAVDIPPYGYSDKNPDFNHSIDSRANLLWRFANKISLKANWIIIGHSMGGGIAQCMAIIKPNKVDKVIFVAPALFDELKPGKTLGQRFASFGPVERVMAIIGEAFYIKPSKINEILQSSFATTVPDSVSDEYYKALSTNGTSYAFIRSYTRAKPEKHINGLKFNTPALAFFGNNDTWVPYSSVEEIIKQLKSVEVIFFESAGHSLMETHPEDFNKRVLDFLQN